MHLTWGSTRVVLLIGSIAVKIARPRPAWILREEAFNPEKGWIENCLRHLLAGVLANRRESIIWQQVPSKLLVPTLFTFFYLVNIQWRGVEVRDEEFVEMRSRVARLTPWLSRKMMGMLDLKPNNLCHYRGHVCILDYGGEEALELLSHGKKMTKFSTAQE